MKMTLAERRPLKEVEETALRLMASRPEGWPSGDLIRAVLADEPLYGQARTVRRAFEVLRDRNLATCDGASRDRRWTAVAPQRTRSGSGRPSVDLSLALLTVRQLANRHLPTSVIGTLETEFDAAARVLEEHPLAPSLREARAWMGKTARLSTGFPLIPPPIDDSVFKVILHALYKDESLDIAYRPSKSGPGGVKRHRVLPYAIVEKGPLWYLVVKSSRQPANEKPFLLRVDRLVDVQAAGLDMARDKKFNLAAYIKQDKSLEFLADKPVRVVLRVRETSAYEHAFRSLRLSEDQEIVEEDGGFVLAATVAPSVSLINLMLEKAASVEVVSPSMLREQVIDGVRQAMQRYGLSR